MKMGIQYFHSITQYLDSRLRGNDRVDWIPAAVYPREGGELTDTNLDSYRVCHDALKTN